jgi:hypothetical protein
VALDRIELDVQLLDLLGALLVRLEDVGRVLALPLRARDLVAGRVLLALQALHLRNEATPMGLERCQLLELRARVQPSRQQALPDVVEPFANECWIKHIGRALF